MMNPGPAISPDYTVLSTTFQCPACHEVLKSIDSDKLQCPVCSQIFNKSEDIWYFIRPENNETYIKIYNNLRHAEGWGSNHPDYYRKLPYEDLTNRHKRIWKIRSRNWTQFLQRVLIPMERNKRRTLKILDIGAGNGWASYRMARRGHDVYAVDIRDDKLDGLGVRPEPDDLNLYSRVIADMNELPFQDRFADLILYNASVHYSEDYNTTLIEGMRVLADDGRIVVLDTPWYSTESEGRKMMNENRDRYSGKYPVNSAIPSFQGFLTRERADKIMRTLSAKMKIYHVPQGFRIWSKRIWRKIRGLRESASFAVLVIRPGRPYPLPEEFYDSWIRKVPFIHFFYLLYLKVYQWFVARFRYNREHFEYVTGNRLLVARQVFSPCLMRSGLWMAGELVRIKELVPEGGKVLDLGTGSGVLAITAGKFTSDVTGIDNNPNAISSSQKNAARCGYPNIHFVKGDLFNPVKEEKFDCILCNPPYFRDKPKDQLDEAWRSVTFLDRLPEQLRAHLNPEGYALFVLSDHGESEWLLDRLWHNRYRIEVVAHHDYGNEVLALYKIKAVRS